MNPPPPWEATLHLALEAKQPMAREMWITRQHRLRHKAKRNSQTIEGEAPNRKSTEAETILQGFQLPNPLVNSHHSQ